MKKNDLILVYGTLRRGERADINKMAGGLMVDFVSEDVINGDMYNLGSYPGVILHDNPGQGWRDDLSSVVGEVYRVKHDNLPVLLDSYEGYPYLYNRQQVPTANRRTVWVYTYNHPVEASQLIDSGDWTTRFPAEPMTVAPMRA